MASSPERVFSMFNLFHKPGAPSKRSTFAPPYRTEHLKSLFEAPDPKTIPRAVECYLSRYVGGGSIKLPGPEILRIAAQVLREADAVDTEQLEFLRKYFLRNLEVYSHSSEVAEVLWARLQVSSSDEFIDIFIEQAEWQAEMEFYGAFPERNIEVVMRHIKLSTMSDELAALCRSFAPQVAEDWTVVVHTDGYNVSAKPSRKR